MHLILAVVPAAVGELVYLWPAKIEVLDISDVCSLTQIIHLADSVVHLWSEFLALQSLPATDRNDDFFLWQRRYPSRLRDITGFFDIQAVVTSKVVQYLGISDATPLRVLSWAAVHELGDYHSPHTHTGEAAVAVLYLRMSEASGPLLLLDPRGTMPPFGRRRELRPRAGTLVIFPSWLPHSAMPSAVDEHRVVIAFNFARNSTNSGSWHLDKTADIELVFGD